MSYSRGTYIAKTGCNGLKGPANKETFECDGAQITVQRYFESKYNITLKYPHLPCVWVGNPEKKNLVPMEVQYHLIILDIFQFIPHSFLSMKNIDLNQNSIFQDRFS